MNAYYKNIFTKSIVNRIFITATSIFIFSCNKPDSFNESTWKSNSDINIKDNPRYKMTSDLITNYLSVGMTRNEIIEIIGLPYKEKIEYRLPQNLEIPDSISMENLNNKNKLEVIKNINNFYRLYSKKDTLMMYNIGWSTIDPKFLTIKLNGYGKAKSFSVE